MNGFFDWGFALQTLPPLITAFLKVTLLVTALGSAIAAVLGLVIAAVRRLAPRAIATVVTFFVNFVRMTPIVVQLMFAAALLPKVEPLLIGIVIFGIHYSTYMAEVYRAGIEDVPKGQWEATTALSMSTRRTWTAVIIPQAIRSTLPALGNYVISMFKDTPFLIAITVVDMVRKAQEIGGITFRYTEPIVLAGIIFLLASYPTSLLLRRLETRLEY